MHDVTLRGLSHSQAQQQHNGWNYWSKRSERISNHTLVYFEIQNLSLPWIHADDVSDNGWLPVKPRTHRHHFCNATLLSTWEFLFHTAPAVLDGEGMSRERSLKHNSRGCRSLQVRLYSAVAPKFLNLTSSREHSERSFGDWATWNVPVSYRKFLLL